MKQKLFDFLFISFSSFLALALLPLIRECPPHLWQIALLCLLYLSAMSFVVVCYVFCICLSCLLYLSAMSFVFVCCQLFLSVVFCICLLSTYKYQKYKSAITSWLVFFIFFALCHTMRLRSNWPSFKKHHHSISKVSKGFIVVWILHPMDWPVHYLVDHLGMGADGMEVIGLGHQNLLKKKNDKQRDLGQRTLFRKSKKQDVSV